MAKDLKRRPRAEVIDEIAAERGINVSLNTSKNMLISSPVHKTGKRILRPDMPLAFIAAISLFLLKMLNEYRIDKRIVEGRI